MEGLSFTDVEGTGSKSLRDIIVQNIKIFRCGVTWQDRIICGRERPFGAIEGCAIRYAIVGAFNFPYSTHLSSRREDLGEALWKKLEVSTGGERHIHPGNAHRHIAHLPRGGGLVSDGVVSLNDEEESPNDGNGTGCDC